MRKTHTVKKGTCALKLKYYKWGVYGARPDKHSPDPQSLIPMFSESEALKRVALRDEERLQRQEQLRHERRLDGAFDLDAFSAEFRERHAAIEARLRSAVEARAVGDLEGVLGLYRGLQQLLNESSGLMAQRDVRRFSADVAELLAAIEKAKEDLQPKKKFAFSKKRTAQAPGGPSPAPPGGPGSAPAAQAVPSGPASAPAAEARITSKSHELIELDMTSTVRLDSLTHCTVVGAAKLQGSCFVTDCADCVFVLRAHQMRIHRSARCQWYAACDSTPIIEDCTAQWFAPHPQAPAPAGEGGDWAIAVHDFNWLKSSPSPNWGLLPPDLRRPLSDLRQAPFGC